LVYTRPQAEPEFYGRCAFFFQAEDGIRDRTVTGVQTCALPISSGKNSAGTTSKKTSNPRRSPQDTKRTKAATAKRLPPTPTATRSEERRVGKECRTRWAPDQ